MGEIAVNFRNHKRDLFAVILLEIAVIVISYIATTNVL